ncbi:right-handed parallel beta-helix repeat-containing protein [Coraliomargarita parva]|uniref:right-handed parallel beta-helix repeat-containing protein n=1 Tax=Coraliomargarita parva TaxID=3014050 RepID=UPI0022B471E0|nr:right-handed parallel beta-helix repeat-containing protein [Coraliomargarita parva]
MNQKLLLIGSALMLSLPFSVLAEAVQAQAEYKTDLTAWENTKARGASNLPYNRLEADAGRLEGGALAHGPSFEQEKLESEASGRVYVALPDVGASVEWIIPEAADGVNLRFTLPDSSDGTGLNSQLAVYVNDVFVQNVSLTSYYAWQYFNTEHGNRKPSNDPAFAKGTGSQRMRFDETRFQLDKMLEPGDRLSLRKETDDGLAIGVDFIEIEKIDPVIAQPEGFLSLADFGAQANTEKDAFDAFQAAFAACAEQGKGLYIPEGRYVIVNKLELRHDGLQIQGAGIWHTELFFKFTGRHTVGFSGLASNLMVSDLYVDSDINNRDTGNAFRQHWGTGSTIKNIWLQHFECGFWIGNYEKVTPAPVADGLRVANCRIRNTYADGLNFAKGSRNCIVEECHVRNNLDDSLATWSSDIATVGMTENNTFRNNTIELTLRAAGIGIFGGQGHTVDNCLVVDGFGGSGIRVSSSFPGYGFGDAAHTLIQNCTIIRCGTRNTLFHSESGGINIGIKRTDVQNIVFKNIEVIDSAVLGIKIWQSNPDVSLRNVIFENVQVRGTGKDGLGPGHGMPISAAIKGWIELKNVSFEDINGVTMINRSSDFEIREMD